MTKFNFFLVVEALLLTLGLITIFNNDITSFIFILVLTLLAVRFFNKESKSDFVLTISLISLFLVSMWNIYVVLAILVGVAYVMINHFSQVKKKNRYALIQFKEDDLNPQAVRNQWIGTHMEPVSDRYDFDDINIIRFFGTDVIDLTQVIVSGRDNVVILQKLYGPTTILVPIDVSVKLNISAIYSSVTFFNEDEYDLRYESLTLQGAEYEHAHRTVKLTLNVGAGPVEVTLVVMDSFNLNFSLVFGNLSQAFHFLFNMFFVVLSLLILLYILWAIANDNSMRSVNQDLRRIINNQPVKRQGDIELDKNMMRLSHKMRKLTKDLQKTENAQALQSRDIIKKERGRIARDLHDTVSQELFAASMILSGVSQMADQLSKEDLHNQIQAVEAMLTDAQNDMRVLLLHLRPTELENKTLQEGLQMILKELTDKSNIHVVYKDMVKKVPKRIENNLFRIAQEFISNTLKHAKASQIEVYLYQNSQEIQLKMLDNGVGYDLNASTDEMSYGLKNIQERVDEMAGTVQFLSAKGKGTSIDVRVPILRGEDNVE